MNSLNKKIKNATLSEYEGVALKSQTEKLIWKTLNEQGIKAVYETEKIVLIDGFKPTKYFYTRVKNKLTKRWELKTDFKKVINITYTPDFIFYLNGYKVYLEVKGFENDVFPVKKKLFRKSLEETHPEALFFEIYTKKQLLQAIEIIKKL